MATGWAKDGAVQDQIDDTIADAVQRARARMPARAPGGDSPTSCIECGEEIPAPRRRALPGVRTCVPCQSERDASPAHSPYNRRGSKDSQLK